MNAGFLILLLLLVLFWLVLIRPQRRRQTQQLRMQRQLEVGDEIVTAGGIYGRVTALGDDLTVEIAPGLEVRVARRAVAGVVDPEEEPDEHPEEHVEPSTDPEPGG